MADTTVEMAISPSRKRDHTGELINTALVSTEIVSPTPDDINTRSTSRQPSEAPSSTSSLTELTSVGINSSAVKNSSTSNGDGTTPAKKRKLTFAEKEVEKAVRKREREEKEKEKAEAKATKDEEKRRKEEEKELTKRAKELAKAEKQKAEEAKKLEKDEKRKAKEQEKEQKQAREEAEKLKKEKSQLRIASFFGRPAPASTPPTTPDNASIGSSSRRSSIATVDISQDVAATSNQRTTNPDFEQYIIPYFVHENTDLAPINRWILEHKPSILDDGLAIHYFDKDRSNIEPLAARFGQPHRRIKPSIPVKTIVEEIQKLSDAVVDLSNTVNPLHSIPYKLLSFREDVRPPYIGTYTKEINSSTARKMARKPTYKGRPDTNYDYDSEAEWEPPAEDDEEILDDEMSDDEDGDGEMEDFLDDDGDLGRRRMFVGSMDPISSGLCWQGEDFDGHGHDMNQYRMDVLHDSTSFPIDPYATTHWTDESKTVPPKIKAESKIKSEDVEKSMPPPRLPLVAVQAPNTIPGFLSPLRGKQEASSNENANPEVRSRGRPSNPNKPLKMVQQEFLPAFKQAIQGSDLTKTGLIEILKKQFPKCSKDAIKDTLGVVAHRVGAKEAEKTWQLKA